MKTYLQDKNKPKNLEQLKDRIRNYWRSLTSELCTKYIDHLKKVMPAIVNDKGGPSGY